MTTQRIVVGAHYGLKDWLAQRITAVVLAVYTLVLGGVVLFGPALTQASWRAIFAGTFMKVFTLLAVAARMAWLDRCARHLHGLHQADCSSVAA